MTGPKPWLPQLRIPCLAQNTWVEGKKVSPILQEDILDHKSRHTSLSKL